MRVALISPFPDITVFGLRTMSAYLRENGHSTRMIFLPDPAGDENYEDLCYEERTLQQLVSLCSEVDIIGITLMTNYFSAAVKLTEAIKRTTDTPVVWGGIHPTVRPNESIEHADIVCVGDGEDALLELVDRMERGETINDVPNMWVRRSEGAVIRNAVRPLSKEIDQYPAPDYSMEDHHIMLKDGEIAPLTREITEDFLKSGTVSQMLGKMGYQTMTGRGCPHKCSYCANDALKNLYDNHNYLRWRSVEHVMAELEQIKKMFPDLGFVWISDDAFFSRPTKSLEVFSRAYKESIGLPFYCLASPLTIKEKKMEMLVDAGLVCIQMGIETGSTRMQEMYNRSRMDNDRVLRAAAIINRYRERMFPPSYDFLLDAPYETTQDKIDSLRLIARLPKPFRLQPFSLVLYPGTGLHELSVKKGLTLDAQEGIYTKSYNMREGNYLNLLFMLTKGGRFPSRLLELMVSKPVTGLLASDWMQPFFHFLYRSLRLVHRSVKVAMGRA